MVLYVEELYKLCMQRLIEECGHAFVKGFKKLTRPLPLQIRHHLSEKFEQVHCIRAVYWNPFGWNNQEHDLSSISATAFARQYIDITTDRMRKYLNPLHNINCSMLYRINVEMDEYITHEIDAHTRSLYSKLVMLEVEMFEFLRNVDK
jgi:hypothetical protein